MVPEHVRTTFTASDAPEVPLGSAWDFGWRVDDLAFSMSPPAGAWSARVRAELSVDGARVVRPVRSTDGRYVVAGWRANHWVDGERAGRVDEVVSLALRLSDALSGLPHPTDLGEEAEPYTKADAMAWNEEMPGVAKLADFDDLQVGHADLLGCTIFHGMNPPAITDLVPFSAPRPAAYTAALVAVDGLLARAVDEGIITRFAHIDGWSSLLARAWKYREQVHVLLGSDNEAMRSNLEVVGQAVMSGSSATM